MNQINEFRHNRLLSKEFDIKEATPSPSLASEIQPVALVADLTRDDPFLGASNEYWCIAGADTTSTVNRATHQLLNRVGSGVVAVVSLVALSASAGSRVLGFTLDQADLSLPTQGSIRINRRGTTTLQTGQLVLGTGESATIVTPEWQIRCSTQFGEASMFQGIVIDEGQTLTMQDSLVGPISLTICWKWREFVRRLGK